MLPLAAAALLCVTSHDGATTLCVNGTSGALASVGPYLGMTGGTSLGGGAALLSGPTVARTADGLGVVVNRTFAFAPAPGMPPRAGATVVDTFSPSPTSPASVRWHVDVVGSQAAPWGAPILTSLSLSPSDYAGAKLWAPWDRMAYAGWDAARWVDPLQPSDLLPSGWWDGSYRLGSPRGFGADFITIPLAAILSADPAAADAGFSLMLAPTDAPADTFLFTRGSERGYVFERDHLRISAGTPVGLDMDVVAHAADWRAALGWAVGAWPAYFEPVNPEVFECCAGTGAYSWYLGNLTNPDLGAMDFATLWDLSGRFFPYMAMRVSEVSCRGVPWLGARPHAGGGRSCLHAHSPSPPLPVLYPTPPHPAGSCRPWARTTCGRMTRRARSPSPTCRMPSSAPSTAPCWTPALQTCPTSM
jgi:hypothetical protein